MSHRLYRGGTHLHPRVQPSSTGGVLEAFSAAMDEVDSYQMEMDTRMKLGMTQGVGDYSRGSIRLQPNEIQLRPKIFESCYTFGGAHGTCLELAIVRDILERRGGTIQVEGRIAGEEGGEVPGTTFTVRMPISLSGTLDDDVWTMFD